VCVGAVCKACTIPKCVLCNSNHPGTKKHMYVSLFVSIYIYILSIYIYIYIYIYLYIYIVYLDRGSPATHKTSYGSQATHIKNNLFKKSYQGDA
jgi:hypothetical protein